MPKISDPIIIRGMEVKNRFAYPPMLTYSSQPNGQPSDRTFRAYEQKARGGVGMMTYEATSVDPKAVGGVQATIGVDENIEAYRKMTDTVHDYGVTFGMQLVLGGMISFAFGWLYRTYIEPIAPSKVDLLHVTSAYNLMYRGWGSSIKKYGVQIRELNVEEIIKFEDLMAAGAKRAIDAGFDYIDIHSCHGSLYASFLAPYLNKRTDKYGGSLEKRCTFLIETVEKIRKSIGEKPPIFVRFSADELLEDGNKINDSIKIAQILENAGVDCIDVSQGIIYRSPYGITVPTYFDHGCFIHLAEAIKKVVNVPVIGVGRIVDPKMADDFIQQGKADIIHMGRQLICDPETPNKFLNGQLDDIRYCIGCLMGCAYVCVQDAYSGQNYQELTISNEPKKIVILGAGIAGMEAARISKLRGHEVGLYEKSNKIGGLMHLVAAEYKKKEFMNLINYLEIQLKKLEVPIHLNKDLTREKLAVLNPDILVLATGSDAAVPLKLKGKPYVLTQDEAILKSKPFGKNIVVWGLNANWRGGLETAILLTEEGYDVKALIGPNKIVGQIIAAAQGRLFWIHEYLRDHNIPIFAKSKLLDVSEAGVKFLDENQEQQFIEADCFVYCGARIANGKALKIKFGGVAPEIVLIGDCNKPQDIQAAMKSAQTFARNLK